MFDEMNKDTFLVCEFNVSMLIQSTTYVYTSVLPCPNGILYNNRWLRFHWNIDTCVVKLNQHPIPKKVSNTLG